MNTYQNQPWLRLYRPGAPADLTPEAPDALVMWRRSVQRGEIGRAHV